jgi:hypothetical protein
MTVRSVVGVRSRSAWPFDGLVVGERGQRGPSWIWPLAANPAVHRYGGLRIGAVLLARLSPSADPEHSKDHDWPVGLQDKVDREPAAAVTDRVGAHVRVRALQVYGSPDHGATSNSVISSA